MRDIQNKEDIEKLVNQFYGKVLKDELLAPFFKHLNFVEHLPKMVDFWAFAVLDEYGYRSNVTDKHMHMPLKQEHFDRWILLFNQTLDSLFSGERADLAKQKAFTIAWTIGSKIEAKRNLSEE